MRLLIVLPSERALLATRRLDDTADNKTVMHALDSDVFHYCCSHTDWASGIIGKHSALSYYRIASALTEDIPRKPSRSLRTVNRNDVRNSIKRLTRVGLFTNASTEGETQKKLILQRPFWQALLRSHSLKNNPDTQQLSGFIAELLKISAFNNKALAKNTTHNPESSYAADATYNTTINITNADSSKFQMLLTWHYDEDLVELFLQAAGFSAKQIKQVWFGKYVQYWSGETIMRTQHEWSLHFANHMQSYLLRPDFFEEVNGMSNQGEKRHETKDNSKHVPMFRDGSQLQAWAIAQGLPVAPVGMTTTQYHQLLCNAVERQQTTNERQGKKVH